jgi:hypothetical protein
MIPALLTNPCKTGSVLLVISSGCSTIGNSFLVNIYLRILAAAAITLEKLPKSNSKKCMSAWGNCCRILLEEIVALASDRAAMYTFAPRLASPNTVASPLYPY